MHILAWLINNNLNKMIGIVKKLRLETISLFAKKHKMDPDKIQYIVDINQLMEFKKFYASFVDFEFCVDALDSISELLPLTDKINDREEYSTNQRSLRTKMFALQQSFIITYARPFGRNNNREKLDVNTLSGEISIDMKIHKSIVDCRNEYMAHEDKNEYEDFCLLFYLHNDTQSINWVAAKQFILVNSANIENYRTHCYAIKNYLKVKSHSIRRQLNIDSSEIIRGL